MSAADQWRWTDERGEARLGATADLRAALATGAVSSSTLVWREGMAEWTAAGALPELRANGHEAPTDAPTMDAPTTEEQTDVRPPPKLESALPEPLPKGKMPTLLGLGSNDPRVSAARAAILAHEAGASKGAKKVAVEDDSIFAEDAIETQVRRESSKPSSGSRPAPPRSRGPVSGAKAGTPARKPTDRPPLTLPYPAAGRPATTTGGTKPPPPPPKPSTPAPPSKAGEAASTRAAPTEPPQGRTAAPLRTTMTSGLAPDAPSPGAASLLAAASGKPATAGDRLEPTAKLPITELLDGEETGREVAAATAAPSAAPAPAPEPPPARRSRPSLPTPPKSDPAAALAAIDAGAIAAAPLPSAAPLAAAKDDEEDAPPRRPRRLGGSVIVPLSSLVAAGGALIVMMVGSFLAGRATATGGLGRSGATIATTGAGHAAQVARDAVPPPPKPCWVSRQPVRWAPEVEKAVPFEVVATKDGGFAVGFARGAREAIGVTVDAASGVVTEQLDEPTSVDVERVTPLPAGGKSFSVALASPDAPLRGAVQLPDDRGGLVGVRDGALTALDRPDAAPTTLFPLGESPVVEALRAQPTGAAGLGLVMRRAGAIWGGFLGAERKPAGDLVKIAGSGGPVGKPMTGWNGREIAVVFADRPAEGAPWEIRVGRAKPPAWPAETTVIALPKGGPGGDAFAPGIAGLADGRWLLVWTEGAPGARAIRAQTLAADLTPVGDPIALSPPAGNFGQGLVAISGDYAATVFLQKGRASYELWGAILQCG